MFTDKTQVQNPFQTEVKMITSHFHTLELWKREPNPLAVGYHGLPGLQGVKPPLWDPIGPRTKLEPSETQKTPWELAICPGTSALTH